MIVGGGFTAVVVNDVADLPATPVHHPVVTVEGHLVAVRTTAIVAYDTHCTQAEERTVQYNGEFPQGFIFMFVSAYFGSIRKIITSNGLFLNTIIKLSTVEIFHYMVQYCLGSRLYLYVCLCSMTI